MKLTQGIYNSIPMRDYLADPCEQPSLSTGIVQSLINRSPTHAYRDHVRLGGRERPPSRIADFGSTAHAAWLGGNDIHVIQALDPRGDQAGDYKTKAAREERDAAKAADQIPVLAHEKAEIDAMMRELDTYRSHLRIEGKSEQTIIWCEDGVWFRSRPDLMIAEAMMAWDYKTSTSAEAVSWVRTAVFAGGYDIKAALILRGIKAVTGEDWRFAFLVQETSEPFACNAVGADASLIEIGNKKIERAKTIWKRCLETDQWPRYGYGIKWASCPNYEAYNWEAREAIWEAEG